MSTQKHAGTRFGSDTGVWHSSGDGGYWSGWHPGNVSPEELYFVCATTMADLLVLHPDLIEKLRVAMTPSPTKSEPE